MKDYSSYVILITTIVGLSILFAYFGWERWIEADMIKQYGYEPDYLEENRASSFLKCLYCGSNIPENKSKYCSEKCKEKNSVWYCEDSAIWKK